MPALGGITLWSRISISPRSRLRRIVSMFVRSMSESSVFTPSSTMVRRPSLIFCLLTMIFRAMELVDSSSNICSKWRSGRVFWAWKSSFILRHSLSMRKWGLSPLGVSLQKELLPGAVHACGSPFRNLFSCDEPLRFQAVCGRYQVFFPLVKSLLIAGDSAPAQCHHPVQKPAHQLM